MSTSHEPYHLGCVHNTSVVAMLECRSQRCGGNRESYASVETLQQKQNHMIRVNCQGEAPRSGEPQSIHPLSRALSTSSHSNRFCDHNVTVHAASPVNHIPSQFQRQYPVGGGSLHEQQILRCGGSGSDLCDLCYLYDLCELYGLCDLCDLCDLCSTVAAAPPHSYRSTWCTCNSSFLQALPLNSGTLLPLAVRPVLSTFGTDSKKPFRQQHIPLWVRNVATNMEGAICMVTASFQSSNLEPWTLDLHGMSRAHYTLDTY
jgi:hypothetical protein